MLTVNKKLKLGRIAFIALLLLSVAIYFSSSDQQDVAAPEHQAAVESDGYLTVAADEFTGFIQRIGLELTYLRGKWYETTLQPEKAKPFFEQAAQQHHATAQYELGMLYLKGLAVEQNNTTAAFWLEKAARQRNADAQYELAILLLGGD